MNSEEYATLGNQDSGSPSIAAFEISGPDRTLLYGYNVDRETYHVYLQDGKIHGLIYLDAGGPVPLHYYAARVWDNAADLVPNKRLYPDACDYEFCLLLKQRGIYLPFTTYRE